METVFSQIGVWSYGLSSIAYLILALLLLSSWHGRLQGGLLVAASAVTCVWGAVFAYHAYLGYPPLIWLPFVEIFKHFIWLLFLLKLFSVDSFSVRFAQFPEKLRLISLSIYGVSLLLVLMYFAIISGFGGYIPFKSELSASAYVVLSVVGLVLLEQLYRNTHHEHRWRVKFLCIGIGGVLVYDLFLYTDALLLKHIDQGFWNARGVVHALVVPLIAISAARNRNWSVDVFVSREVVFHTATLMWVGGYLLAVSVGGYYVRTHGGSWGGVAQAILLFGASIILIVMLFSGHIQARIKIFLSKHFYKHKYDYRTEWLNFISALSADEFGTGLRKRVVQVIAEIVDSKAGVLWLRQGNRGYESVAYWKTPEPSERAVIAEDDHLVEFLKSKEWLVDLDEFHITPEQYGSLRLPDWLEQFPTAWVVVPLRHESELIGFVLLMRSLAPRSLNWEDHDLLKTVGKQAASYLALEEASAALADARQFEAFNRLSAYVVHDLKNVVGQLSLVASNAKKHKENQAFVDDAFATVENAVEKMQRMLGQLRKGRESLQAAKAVKLPPILEQVVANRSAYKPVPSFSGQQITGWVVAEKDRLASVIEHIVNNAQDATPDDGKVDVRLIEQGSFAVIEIEDNGCGMDQDFIRHRLFKPFDTTKGNAGMGIGAYECQEFIRSLGGEVNVESEPGQGSLFRLKIPLTTQ